MIKIDGVWKQYKLGNTVDFTKTFREVIAERFSSPKTSSNKSESFWALQDINLSIQSGRTLGLIGHNGAGKSTLLKVLSRITKPTKGKITIHGSLSSLLEVGTGFHPELSGRENIYLCGSIMGMSRRDIDLRFEQIVDYAGVEKFIDTPVKRYSSGMYVRLAFSIAAHVEPDILVVDEVLAVGDKEFREKCLGKMDDVAQSGRTVIFVSHNMASISSLCQDVAWMNHGEIIEIGQSNKVISSYENSLHKGTVKNRANNIFKGPLAEKLKLTSMTIQGKVDVYSTRVNADEELEISASWAVKERLLRLSIYLVFHVGETRIMTLVDDKLGKDANGEFTTIFRVPANTFRNADISISVDALERERGMWCWAKGIGNIIFSSDDNPHPGYSEDSLFHRGSGERIILD